MVVLTRRSGEGVRLDPAVEVTVLGVQADRVTLGVSDGRRPPAARTASGRGYYVFRKGTGRLLVLHRRAGEKVRVNPVVQLAMLAIRDGLVTLGVDAGLPSG